MLHRKLGRDLFQHRGQVVAIALVMACGVATLVLSWCTYTSLERSLYGYYREGRFADVFASLERAPRRLADRIAAIPGVTRVQTRVAESVTLDLPDLREPAVGYLISLPPGGGDRAVLNAPRLRVGRWPEPGRGREVVVIESFATVHGLVPGDRVRALINGRFDELRIVGVVLSPEYVYPIRPGELLPDDKRFGIFWMDRTELAAAFDMEGAFNDLAAALAPDASEAEVIRRIDDLIDRYGGLGAFGRADQTSHKFLVNELNELRTMAVIVPTIFLGVAAFLLHIVLGRLVATQREQIAALKALGYGRLAIGRHYLEMILAIAVVGAAIGVAAGTWMGGGLTRMYAIFFHLPRFGFRLDPAAVVTALGVTTFASVGGALDAVRRAMRLQPAEAMRPQAPASYRPTILERGRLQRWLPIAMRMVLRQLERRPARAILSALGVAAATSILVVGSFMEDSIDLAMRHEFHDVQRNDVTVAFYQARGPSALGSLEAIPGVLDTEPQRVVPARLVAGHRSRRVGIIGLPTDARLMQLRNIDGGPVAVPEDGLLLSQKLAEVLEIRPGDAVRVEVLDGDRPVLDVPLAGTVRDFAGLNAWMSLEAANRMFGESRLENTALATLDPRATDAVYRELKRTPLVATVTVKEAAVAAFEETVAETIMMMRSFNIGFAMVIAFGVIYNAARISFSERSRELATLRIMGFTRGEIALIQLGELAIITAVAIPGGLLLGRAMGWVIIHAYETELFRMPLLIEPSTYGFASTVIAIAAIISGAIVLRLLSRLDLVSVLKTRE